jgi:hypothetical protein
VCVFVCFMLMQYLASALKIALVINFFLIVVLFKTHIKLHQVSSY